MTVLLPFRRYLLGAAWCRNLLWKKARAVPSLDLDFAGTKSLNDGISSRNLITFTRASSGTYVGSDGVLRSAVTNLLLRSEEFDNASWTKVSSTISANAAAAPNGTTTADKLIVDNGQSAGYAAQSSSFTSGITWTVSCFAKASEVSDFRFVFESTAFGSNLNAVFNLSTGVVTSFTAGSASIQALPNGWYRCIATATTTATASASIQFRSVHAGNGTNGIFVWGAQLEQASTVGEYVPTVAAINSAPRFDHNPTTGESLGLLVEEARTNSIRNNTGVGAVAGTPGTLPTNWGIDVPGLTTSVIGTGTSNGISYIDIRLNGTTSAGYGNIFFESSSGIAATNAQTWAHSLWLSTVGGTTTNLSAIRHAFDLYSSTPSYLATVVSNLTGLSASQSRFSAALTTNNASTAFVRPSLSLLWSSGAAIDITLRIGLPQLEQGAFATSAILTTTATVTRAADVASITGSNFSSWYNQTEGTVFADAKVTTVPPATSLSSVFALSDGTTSNRIAVYKRANADTSTRLDVQTSGSSVAFINAGTFGLSNLTASCYRLDDFASSLNGLTPGTDTLGAIPTVSRLNIGSYADATFQLNGTIKRLAYWPTRLANTTLQAISQP